MSYLMAWVRSFFLALTACNRWRGRSAFLWICAYYILAAYLIPSTGSIEKFSPAYFALVVPGWLYIVVHRHYLFSGYGVLGKMWLVFLLCVLLAAAFQENPSLAYNGLYLGLLAIVVANSGGYLRTEEINILFLTTVVGSVAIYMLGLTDYGFLPGQADAPSCHQGLAFRVSLFRVTAESAVLSLFTLLCNIYFPSRGRVAMRVLVILLALYFLIFSGIRTALVALLVVLPALIYQVATNIKPNVRLWIAVLVPLVIVMALLLRLANVGGQDADSDFVSNYILRTGTCASYLSKGDPAKTTSQQLNEHAPIERVLGNKGVSINWLHETINRHCSAKYELDLFGASPWIGNLDVRPNPNVRPEEIGCTRGALDRYCEACVLATYWLSKGGMAGVVLIGIYLWVLGMALKQRNAFGVVALLCFGIISQGWGVLFIPYNFTFYLLLSVTALIGGANAVRSDQMMKGKP